MKTINKAQLETFFMSLGWAGDYKDPEAVHGGIVRGRKGSYLHLPLMKIEYRTKDEFLDRIDEIAEALWKKAEEQRKTMP